MKNAILKAKLVLMALGAVLILSCSAEDGMDGAPGAQGPQGEQGPAGQDGTDGTDGQDGEDGNANVQTFVFDISGQSGSSFGVTIPELTQEALDNDLILGYIKHNNLVHPIPAVVLPIGGNELDVAVDMLVGQYALFFFDGGTTTLSNISAGDLEQLKIVIASSTSTTTAKLSKEDILSRLKEAGVSINDYYAVMDYFGLDY